MKDFFLNLLNRLYSLAGLRQLENIQATSADPKKEIADLLSELDDVCKKFSFIPDDEKKKILHNAVITDPKITSLNAAFVYRHLAAHSDRFFMQEHHKRLHKPEAEPLTGEARQEKLRQWAASLGEFKRQAVEKENLRDRLPGTPPEGEVYRPPTPEDLAKRELHNQWIRENYDVYGNKRANYQDETTWLKSRKP